MLTVQEMAKLAAKHHYEKLSVAEYEAKISKRPSAWASICQEWLGAEKAQAKANRKPSFTEQQKALLDAIKKQPIWKTYCDVADGRSKTVQSLIKRGVISRIQYGSNIEYIIN